MSLSWQYASPIIKRTSVFNADALIALRVANILEEGHYVVKGDRPTVKEKTRRNICIDCSAG